jgi:drug/metabolite transporter (DMT)-like permease
LVKATLLALGAIALWSTNALVAKQVLGGLGVEQVQLLQFAGAAGVFLAARIYSRSAPGQSLVLAIALGLLGVTGTMVFQYLAFASGPIAEVNIVAYAWPLLAAMLALAGGRVERPVYFLALTILGFLGAAMVIARDGDAFRVAALGPGHAWAIASAVCMAGYSAAIGRVNCNKDTAHLAGALAGLALAAGWCVADGAAWPNPSAATFWLALYLGAGPIGIGYLLWARAMQNDFSGKTASLGYLTPVGSTSLLLLSGVTMGWIALLGSLVVIACCAATGIEAQRDVRA